MKFNLPVFGFCSRGTSFNVVPAPEEGGGEGPTPLVFSDFKNGVYAISGVSKTLGQVWESNATWSPTGFNPALVVGGVGYVVPEIADAPALTSAATSAVANGYVVVVTANFQSAGSVCSIVLEAVNDPSWTLDWYLSMVQGAGVGTVFMQDAGNSNDPYVDSGVSLTTDGLHKIAARAELNSFAISVDGSSQISDTAASGSSLPLNLVGLNVNAPDAGQSITIEKIEFFSLSDYDATDLPTLSA